MPRDIEYIAQLETALANDYSVKSREGLVGAVIAPRVGMTRPEGSYYTFTKEQAYKVTDDTLSETGEAKNLTIAGTPETYKTIQRGNKILIKNDEKRFKIGPFIKADKDFIQKIVDNIEKNQERRIRDKFLGLSGRSAVLSGTGSAKTNKWASNGGDPFLAIQDAIKACFYRPNLMVVPEGVFDVLEFHSILLAKLGEANMIKKVSEETLAKLFRIDRVVIAKGKADFGKQKADKSVDPSVIWGNNVMFTYTDSRKDVPCGMKSLIVEYAEADGAGYVVRKWDEPKKGILGGYEIQVACDISEHVISSDLCYSIQEVL
ncbi:MAG: hypothetical protein JXB50_12245 [Spirochaetes bacterium]|nr:hypothetical protein [Spirochaetota bacterium]